MAFSAEHGVIRRCLLASGGVRLSTWDWGTGAGGALPFLLVHGLASNARLWDGVARRLAAAGHPVVAVDQRGHGLSDKPDWGYDSRTIVEDLVAVLDDLGWQRAIAVGQSWGGNVVVELAARSPDRLAGACGVDGGTLRLAQRFATWQDCRTALTPPVLLGARAIDVRARMEAAHPDWPVEGIDGAMASFEVVSDGTVAPWLTIDHHLAILAGLYAADPARLYALLEVSTLFITAADPAEPDRTAAKHLDIAEAVATIPHARAVWLSPADHDVHAQKPEQVARTLLDQCEAGFFA